MSVMLEEQETIINWTRGDECAEIYTSDTTTMTKLDRMCKEHPESWSVIDSKTVEKKIVSKTYKCPRMFISFRGSRRKTNQKGNVEALRRWRESKMAGDV